MINQSTSIKELRLVLDAISEGLKITISQDSPGLSRNVRKASESVLFCKAWLGACLEEYPESDGYKNGYKNPQDIEPTKEKVSGWDAYNHDIKSNSYTENIDYFRSQLKKLTTGIKEILTVDPTQDNKPLSREFSIARTNAYSHLRQAGFYLGFELQKIRETLRD